MAVNQIVLQTDEEARFPRIALTPRPAAQLVVDAARFVSVRSKDVQTAQCDHALVVSLVTAAQALGAGPALLLYASNRAAVYAIMKPAGSSVQYDAKSCKANPPPR